MEKDLYDPEIVEEQKAYTNAKNIFGSIDGRQDWSSINSGTITITANAPLKDIVRVEILTESPFFNSDAYALNQTSAKKGDVITLRYDAPNIYKQLVAACVDSRGTYYIQVFNIGDKNVSFGSSASGARRAAASDDDMPDPSGIKLEYKNSLQSFNAQRALKEGLTIKDEKGTAYEYTEWENTNWAPERIWTPTDANLGTWSVTNGNVSRNVEDLTTQEIANIKAITDGYLAKCGSGTDATNGKRNNWKRILDGKYFTINNNYLVSNGTPITLCPIQMNSTEGRYNYIYYYYFDPAKTQGMTEEEEVAFIQALPKYRAINGFNGNSDFKREKEYLLPYYGDEAPGEAGTTAVSVSIPKGYKIGFMNRKATNRDCLVNKNGCTYGDGRLNYAVNHIRGHYRSAMDLSLEGKTTEGMNFTSPRIAIFSANDKTYMCFEDGADCNFSDMIIQINKGTEVIDEEPAPEAAAYTMCFEDRLDNADYDMNDVVIQAIRVNATHIQLAIVACGGEDEVRIQGLDGSYLASKEVHAFFGVTPGEQYINTRLGEQWFNPVSETFEVSADTRIEEFLKKISIMNYTTGKTVSLPVKGDPPFAIIVPLNFRYPLEGYRITKAYTEFLNWARDINQSNNWYTLCDVESVYPDMFTRK